MIIEYYVGKGNNPLAKTPPKGSRPPTGYQLLLYLKTTTTSIRNQKNTQSERVGQECPEDT